MATFFVREKARDDLVAHFVYLAENAKYDAAYWLRIPVDKRAEFVWELSVEAFSLPPVR